MLYILPDQKKELQKISIRNIPFAIVYWTNLSTYDLGNFQDSKISSSARQYLTRSDF